MPRAKTAPREAAESQGEQGFDFKKPFQHLKPESFWPFLQQYPSWEAGALYVYRIWPVIDRRLTGHKEKYIDVFAEPITELDLLRKHGSGKYQIHFNDSNRPKNLANVATCKVEINDPMFDPVVPLEEVVEGADANKSYIDGLKARGKWRENPVSNTDGGQATAELAKTLNNMVDRVMDRPQPPQEPTRQDPFDIALKMVSMMPKPAPAADPMELALKIADRMQAGMQAPAPQRREVDPLEIYVKVADVIESRANRQSASTGGGTDWGGMLLGFVNALPQLIQGFMMMRAMPPQPPPAGDPSGYPPAAAPVVITPPVAPVQSANPDLPILFDELKPFLLGAIVQGQTGDEFASALVTFRGEDRYRQLASFGLDGLLAGLQNHADLWMMLSPYEEQVRTFIQEFLDYGKAEPEVLEGATE